jgi:lipoprotein-anchoring transpeptidase ErfK/SrfK
VTRLPTVVVSKSRCELKVVTPEGERTYPVSIGSNPDSADKQEVGDCRTPEGEFTVVSVEDSSDWEHEGERVYGPLFLRLDCPPWEGIGIHGTNRPDLLGTLASRGCVRMRNEDLLELAAVVGVGARVRIVA